MTGPEQLAEMLRADLYMRAVLLTCCLVTGYGLKARPMLGLRLTAMVGAEALWAGLCTFLLCFVWEPAWSTSGVIVAKYLGTYLLAVAAFRFCLRCGWTAALYGGTTGYILQHCSERMTEVSLALLPSLPAWASGLLLPAITALSCVCFVALFQGRSNVYSGSGSEDDIMLVTAAAVVGAVIVLEPLIQDELQVDISAPVKIYINIISILLSLLALVISMCQMRQAESKRKAQVAAQLLHAERSRYAREKETVDAINIRCHDIKHQIAALGDVGRQKELRELERLVNIYDCGLKTECAALDLVLSNKSLVCSGKQIALTCVADGQQLRFMEDADIYALFGNILDNAIEAVERLDDPDMRLISLTIHTQQNFLIIREENYYDGVLVMDQGLPLTTKADKRFHGFGMQSVRTLTEKYGGDLQLRTGDGIYRLSILFPVESDTNP